MPHCKKNVQTDRQRQEKPLHKMAQLVPIIRVLVFADIPIAIGMIPLVKFYAGRHFSERIGKLLLQNLLLCKKVNIIDKHYMSTYKNLNHD
jgi:hypothetical protein